MLNDFGVELDRVRELIVHVAPAASGGGQADETGGLRDEIARLRRMLRRHGIDPDAS